MASTKACHRLCLGLFGSLSPLRSSRNDGSEKVWETNSSTSCHGFGIVGSGGSRNTLDPEVLFGNSQLFNGGNIQREKPANRFWRFGVGNCFVDCIQICLAASHLFAREISMHLIRRDCVASFVSQNFNGHWDRGGKTNLGISPTPSPCPSLFL